MILYISPPLDPLLPACPFASLSTCPFSAVHPPIQRQLISRRQVDVNGVDAKKPLVGVAVSWPVLRPDGEDLIGGRGS